MALTARVDLTGQLCVEDGCKTLKFSDVTGFLVTTCNDEYNELGYGLVGGIALNDVTQAVLNVYFPSMTTPVTFTFTIASHVITGATLTDLDGTVTDITDLLESTVFPLNEFDTTLDYGVILPTLADGIVKWDYTITGLDTDSETFSYTTSDEALITCETSCCVENSYLEIDTNCGCFDEKIKKIITSEVLLQGAKYAMNVGQDSKAEDMLTKAKDICVSNCKDC